MKITKTKLKQIIKEELEALEKTDDAADSPQGKGARSEPNNPPLRRVRIDEDELSQSLRLIMVALSKTKDPFARLPRGTMPPMFVEASNMADEIMSGKMSLLGAIAKLIRASSVANPPAID
jgi:hypothetical protein